MFSQDAADSRASPAGGGDGTDLSQDALAEIWRPPVNKR